MEAKQSNSQNLTVEGTSELGKAIDPYSDSDWEWDMNSDSDSDSDSDTLGFSNDQGEQIHQRWKWLKLPWRRPLSSHTVRFRNDLGEVSQRLLRRWPLSSEGDPNPMNLRKRVMKWLDKKAQFDTKAEASGPSCAHSQNLIYMKHWKRVMKWLKELDKKAQFDRKAEASRALRSQNLIRSKINVTGPSTQLEDDRSVHERIKQSAEILNRTKDIVCLIISYPPMSLVNGESYKQNQYKWVRDILKINDVVREMEAPSKKKEIDAFKLENRISTLMTRYMDEIEPLFPQVVIAKSFSGIDVERHGQIMPTPKRIYDLAVDFAIREILQYIEYPKIRKIGISGSHGETVISKLRGELQECCIFDHVIDVDVSRCSTIEEIRFSIERELFPSTSGERKLDETLKGTNFFILLHEVGERVNLYDMGTNWWNSKKIQKMVYTTNSQNVDNVTAVGVEIRMENHLLSWELFCVNVGEVVHSSGIQRLAINVVEKCCGHLLAVVIMARALKEVNDVLIWEYASYTLGLQHRSQTKDRVLFNALAFMWGRSGSTNKYVQYCVDMENWGQMEKVHLIEEWITSGLVGTFDEGEQIVGDLVNAFLLESFQYGDSNFVGMRREIHEELLNFLRFESCSPFLRLGGWGLTEPPKDEAWEKASEMHLMNNKLSELPTSPHGSQLKVLFLQSNHHLRAIPPMFFEGLPVLQILDLSYTRIRSLPQSLFKLFELRIFFLRGCELLMELPPEVGKLGNLEVLNLEGTKIIKLPVEVSRLKKLKFLKLSFHGYRKSQSSTPIPLNVIQELFQLQDLSIDVNPDDERWNAAIEDIVQEVCSLEQLEALKLYVPHVAPLDHFMRDGTSSVYLSLVHFRFVVGSHHSRIISRLPHELAVKFELQEKSLKYVNGEGIPSQIKEVLQHCTALFLDRHLTLTKLSEFGIGNMKKLEFCVLGECCKIETIVDEAENCKQQEDDGDVYGENILGSLQFLRLHYMKNLVSIWKGPVWRGCLSSLKSLALHECPRLTTIFTLGLLENLNSLEELVAEWCPEINSIVTLEDPAEHRPFPLRTYLPNLRKISLHYMPKLVNISSGLHIAPKLEWMSFYNCPRLETLSDKEVCCNSIKVIIGEADWWSKLKRSSYFGLAQWHNVFVPIKSDADLATQIEEIENQLLAERQERKPSQQSGEAERQERKPSQQSGETERKERKPSQQSGEAERQERKPSRQSGFGGFRKAPAFGATTASMKMKISFYCYISGLNSTASTFQSAFFKPDLSLKSLKLKTKQQELLIRVSILTLVYILAFITRLFGVLRYESMIHEFDPDFNYRTTVFLTEKGFYEFWNWFDSESSYPLGRIIGGTLYPGLMVTAALIYSIIRFLRFTVHIREVCVLTAPFFASNTTIVAYFFGKELWDSGAGLVAAALIAICPGYISRSVAGSYDNEGVAIFALLLSFYLFVKAVNTGSLAWALASAFGYFYMVSAWGGYVFIINLIPLYAMVLLITGRYSMRLYVAYNCMYILGMLLVMQIRFVGFQHVQSGEHMAAMGVFFLMQVFYFLDWVKHLLSDTKLFQAFLRITVTCAVGVGAIALGVGTASGYISPWTGRFYSLLDPTYAKDHIPIIASVSEHQPAAWSSFMFDFHILLFLFPAGLYFCFKRLSDATIFIVMYGLTSMYFAGVMVQLILVATPAVCLISAIAVSATIKNLTQLVRTKSKVAHTGSTKGTTSGKASSKASLDQSFQRNGAIALLIGAFYLLCEYATHCTWVTSKAYSSPSIFLAARGAYGNRVIFDDYREAYFWLRQNTPPDAKVMSWWDYGYQITAIGNRIVIVDNNTWNNTHIATVGRAMSSYEDEAYEIMRSLDVDYVLVVFGGVTGYSSDDINKFLWMVRIGGRVFPVIKEPDYLVNGEYRVDKGAAPKMLNCLMYKLSYYRFGELRTEYGKPPGYDRARRVEIGNKDIKLEYLEEAFTTSNWIVRIYKVKPPNNRRLFRCNMIKETLIKETPTQPAAADNAICLRKLQLSQLQLIMQSASP